MEKGKIIENIHYYGDKITKYYLNKIKNWFLL
jgi:predicted ribosome-associated RNA-binding protein Tma20